MSLLGALQGAFSDGPDPTRFSGLLALSQLRVEGEQVEGLKVHLEAMLARVEQARTDREQESQQFLDRYDEELLELIEQNLRAYREVEDSLQRFIQVLDSEPAIQQSALRQLSTSVEELEQSSEELSEIQLCGDLVCLHCGMPGQEVVCPTCQVDCYFPDPDGRAGPGGELSLPRSYSVVFTALTNFLKGEALLEELLETLEPLEEQLEQAEDMLEEVLEQLPEEERANWMADAVDDCLEAISQMREVETSRRLRDLNQGWTDLVKSSVELQRLLPNLGIGTLA